MPRRILFLAAPASQDEILIMGGRDFGRFLGDGYVFNVKKRTLTKFLDGDFRFSIESNLC